ncbi:Hypothetical protein EAG7_02863 [Klebsiella aerogenes]|nr:Hypothetical protein EAG7_02863 [Klebsiella aerogenes]
MSEASLAVSYRLRFYRFSAARRAKQAIYLRRCGVEGQSRTERANNP